MLTEAKSSVSFSFLLLRDCNWIQKANTYVKSIELSMA